MKISAYRAYLRVFIRRHSACVCESSGLYVKVAGISFFLMSESTKFWGDSLCDISIKCSTRHIWDKGNPHEYWNKHRCVFYLLVVSY